MVVDWIYNAPVWLGLSLIGIAGSGIIVLVVRRLMDARTRHAHNGLISFMVTNIAVLYAVLLAFIAVAAWENRSKASEIVGTEADLVGDLYVDAARLNDKGSASELQNKLYSYIRGVLDEEWREQQSGRIPKAASPALRGFHKILASFEPKTSGDTIVMQEMLHSLNELYNARRARLEAAGGHIPNMVWRVIFFLGLLTVGITALMGVHNLAWHFAMVAGLTSALMVVVVLIVQLDYPFRGGIGVSPDAFERVFLEMGLSESALLPSGTVNRVEGRDKTSAPNGEAALGRHAGQSDRITEQLTNPLASFHAEDAPDIDNGRIIYPSPGQLLCTIGEGLATLERFPIGST
jgi:hypothetical protein